MTTVCESSDCNDVTDPMTFVFLSYSNLVINIKIIHKTKNIRLQFSVEAQ